MNNSLRRAGGILARCRWLERRPTGKHHRDTQPPRQPIWGAAAATAAILALTAGVGWVALTSNHVAPAASTTATDCPPPTAQQTERFLSELELAGVPLPRPEDRVAAAQIGAVHVEHCHLIGMRWQIERDLRRDLPHLSDEQVVTARVAVEHLFLDVTGRKQ